MHPSNTTPTPGCLNQQADTSNHTHENLQAAPAGAPAAPVSPKKPSRNASADLSRLYLQYLSNPTQDRLDELLNQCLKFLEKRVSYWVNCRDFCPPWLPPDLFTQDAFDRACDKFWSKIHALRSPQLLERWLKKVAFSAVVEELRYCRRRTKKWPCTFEPLDIEYDDGVVSHVLDRAENRDAAMRYGCVTVEQTQFVKQLVYRDLLGKLFRADLKLILHYDLTADELAAELGVKKSIVLSLLRAARQKLREIAETQYGFTSEDL